jgi:hypothetical protein
MADDDWAGMRITSSDGMAVGSVGSVLWQDPTGTRVIRVAGRDHDFVIAVKPTISGDELHTSYTHEMLLTGPSATRFEQLIAKEGADAALQALREHYHVELSGPPPGPPTTPVPPWWRRVVARARALLQGDDEG